MSQKIIEYMAELDLTSQENISSYFMINDIETIQSLVEYVRHLAIEDWSTAEYSPYLFAPSAEVSGFGGCYEIECKLRRAEKFIRFASLYSDTIYLFVESITMPHEPAFADESERFGYRYDLMCDFTLILLYSHLLERRIAKIIPPNFGICRNCFAKYIANESNLKLLDPLIQDYCRKALVEATSYDDDIKMGRVIVKNLPELFPDHDGFTMINGGKRLKTLKALKAFPSVVRNQKFIEWLIQSYVYKNYLDSRFEAYMSSMYQSKLIISKQSDKAMFDIMAANTVGGAPSPVFEMPFLDTIDTDTILKIREDERQAFNDYRVALDKAAKLYGSNPNPIESKEIYDDIIYPAFLKLDAMFERTKKMHIFKAVSEFLVISSTVTLGVMNSVIPANPIGIATALGGTGALVNQISGVVERKLNSGSEMEAKDFYFLWKLKNTKRD